MKSIMRRSLAVVMAIAMLLSMLVVPAFAAEHVHTTDNDPCEHAGTDAVKTEKVEPTCQQNGGIWHTCSICGDVWVTDEVAKDPNAHKMAGEATTIEATCWREGYTTGDYCTNEGCNYNTGIINRVPMYSHDPAAKNTCLVVKEKTLADCLEGGVIIYECKFKDYPADANGSCTYNGEHDVTSGPEGHKHELRATDYQAPTCHNTGWVTVDCTKCDDTFKVTIAATGHNFVPVSFAASSCTLAGYDEGAYCDNEWLVWGADGKATKVTCSAYYNTTKGLGTEANPIEPATDLDKEALRHDATSQHSMKPVTEPTYKGEASYQQAMCGANAQNGWQWYKCEFCDADYKEALEPAHEEDTSFKPVVTEPTCTEQGYTTRKCAICKGYYETDFTPIKHVWVSTEGVIVYTFVKDGKTFVKAGDVRELDDALDVTINFIPYMVPAADLLTDPVAQQLIAEGYSEVAWTVMSAVGCGKKGDYVHKCDKCDVKGFLTIVVDHVWDGDINDVDSKSDIVAPTCTTAGGYMGTCVTCGNEFILSEAMVGANDPDYRVKDFLATGHMSKNGPVLTKDPATGKFVYPRENEVPATCIAFGTPAFNYCNNENCPDNLPNYATALAANKDTIAKADHQYFDANGVAYKPVKVQPTCMYSGFEIATCKVCDLQYNLDSAVNGGNTNAYDHRIKGSEFGEFDGVSHVYPAYYGTPDHPVAKAPTCAEAGRWADVQCTLCPYVSIGGEIAKLDPGAVPTYNATMKNGDKIGGWVVVVTAPKCTTPGKVEVYCEYCAANGTNTHETVKIHDFAKTGTHFIAGATYVKNADGSYKIVKGAYVVDRNTLTNAQTSCTAPDCATTHIANAGGCDENVNNLHADHYACAECGDVIFFSVRFDHIEGAATCGNPTKCVECDKELVDAVPHDMVRVDPAKTYGDDNLCTTEFYYYIACTKCGFGNESQGFAWTAEWKAIAGYVEAQEHDYNGLADGPSCERDQECVNDGCDFVNATKVGHENQKGYSKTYTNPTCIAKGFWTIKCPAGEACDKYVAGTATIVEEGGVKYAVWTEIDEASQKADHKYVTYLTKAGDCLSYNVVVKQCVDCYQTATKDANGFISDSYVAVDFKDPTGHKLVDNNKVEDCDEGGCYWKNCEYCFDEAKYNKGTDGMWNTKDWKGELGYTEKTYTDPTGHWYWSTPAAGEEAQKIFFDLTCVDLLKHNNPTCEDCKKTFIAEEHHNISKEYTLKPTCTETGLSWKYCTNEGCDYKDILSVEPALGHTSTKWTTVKAANCCEAGTARLDCTVCGKAIKEGELILKGTKLVPATAGELTKTLTKLSHKMVKDEAKSTAATIHSEGVLVKKCTSTSHKCTYTETEKIKKLDVVEFSATIDNAVKPGHMVFVNGGTIAYTISIDAEAKALFGVQLYVNFDNSKLTYVGFDLGADKANLFGTVDANGSSSTIVGSMGGVVSIMANVNNTADGTVVDAPVNEKLEFVTLYFKINSNTITDNALDKGFETALSMSNIIVINSKNVGTETDPDIAFANDYETSIVNADSILVEKLGDANVLKTGNGQTVLSDGLVNLLDVQYIQNHVLNKTYDARADIDQNGVINILDIVAIQRYIVFAQTYAEMAASSK